MLDNFVLQSLIVPKKTFWNFVMICYLSDMHQFLIRYITVWDNKIPEDSTSTAFLWAKHFE